MHGFLVAAKRTVNRLLFKPVIEVRDAHAEEENAVTSARTKRTLKIPAVRVITSLLCLTFLRFSLQVPAIFLCCGSSRP